MIAAISCRRQGLAIVVAGTIVVLVFVAGVGAVAVARSQSSRQMSAIVGMDAVDGRIGAVGVPTVFEAFSEFTVENAAHTRLVDGTAVAIVEVTFVNLLPIDRRPVVPSMTFLTAGQSDPARSGPFAPKLQALRSSDNWTFPVDEEVPPGGVATGRTVFDTAGRAPSSLHMVYEESFIGQRSDHSTVARLRTVTVPLGLYDANS